MGGSGRLVCGVGAARGGRRGGYWLCPCGQWTYDVTDPGHVAAGKDYRDNTADTGRGRPRDGARGRYTGAVTALTRGRGAPDKKTAFVHRKRLTAQFHKVVYRSVLSPSKRLTAHESFKAVYRAVAQSGLTPVMQALEAGS